MRQSPLPSPPPRTGAGERNTARSAHSNRRFSEFGFGWEGSAAAGGELRGVFAGGGVGFDKGLNLGGRVLAEIHH